MSFVVRNKKRLINRWADFLFAFFQKPFYSFCFNSKGNRFECKGKMRNSHVLVEGHGNTILIGNKALLNKVDVSISGYNNQLIIHDNVCFLEGGRIRIEDGNNIVEIADRTMLVNCFFSAADTNTRLIVGRDCLFSAGVVIRKSDSHSILNSSKKRINSGRDVIIGNHVWIGYDTTILKGSTIGDNSIVGTKSVVSGQQIEQNVVAVGNPCRIVKNGVNWTEKRI